jgi:hypothetical protein
MFSGHSRDYPTNSIFYSESQEQKHVKEETHRLRQLLVEIHTALEAAKGCAITNSWLLRWLRELEDAACRGDQTLRNWTDMSSKVSSIIDSSNSFKRIKIAASQLIPSKESTMKVSATVKKLEAVASGIPKFTQLLSLQNDQAVLHHRPVIIFVSIHDRVVGRVDERKQAIEFLLHIDKNGSSSPDGCVLPIWGVKGVGKTTIARLVCDDRKVRSHFSMIIWVNCREYTSPAMALVKSLCKKLGLSSNVTINLSSVIRKAKNGEISTCS